MRCNKASKPGFMLIAALFFMLAAAVVGILAASSISKESDIGVNSLLSAQALFIAEAGMQYAMEDLSSSGDWSTYTGGSQSFAGGSFTISVDTAQAASITIRVTGTINGVSREIVRSFTAFQQAFQYMMYSGKNINMILAAGDITGDIAAENNVNMSIFTDHDGDVYDHVDDVFPNVTDYDYWKDQAIDEGQYVTGNKTFENGQSYEGVWYVTGNVTIRNVTQINGTIVAEGHVFAVLEYGATITAPEGQPAIVTQGNFHGGGSLGLTVNGLIYAENDINLNLALFPTINGAMVAGNNMLMVGLYGLDYTYNPDYLEGMANFQSSSVSITAGEDWEEG